MSRESGDLERDLGLLEATSIGLGAMIGGGIFILPSIAAGAAGPASVLSFALAGAISLLAALSHAEVATDMPKEGGSYQYVHYALGPLAGSIIGLGTWIGLVFASAFYAIGFAQYLSFFHEGLPIVGAALALAILLTVLNYCGTYGAGFVQDLIVVSLLVLLTVFVAVGIFHVDVATLRPINPGGWSAVVATTGTVYVALIGFGLIAAAAGSVKNPARNLPLAMVIAVVLPTVFYVLVMIVVTGVVPADEVAQSRVPVADVAGEYLGWAGVLAMVIGAILATVSSANASILSAGQISYSMSEDEVLTSWFRKTHERFGSPNRAILATGTGLLVLISFNVGLSVLAEVASFLFLVAYALVHVAVIKLRRDDGIEYDPTFTIPDALYPYVPVVGILSILAVIPQMKPRVIAGGAGLVVVGIGWYVVYVRPDRNVFERVRSRV